MFISDEGQVAGSVNRAELAAAYSASTDETARLALAAVGVEHGMYVEGDRLVDPSAPAEPEPAPEPEAEPASSGRPVVADNKATWVDWAVSQGLEREDAESLTKAELVELYGGDKE